MNCTVINLPQCLLLQCIWAEGSYKASSAAILKYAPSKYKIIPCPCVSLTITHFVLFFTSKFIIGHTLIVVILNISAFKNMTCIANKQKGGKCNHSAIKNKQLKTIHNEKQDITVFKHAT